MDTYRVQRRDMEKKAKRLRREGYVTGNLFGKESNNQSHSSSRLKRLRLLERAVTPR